MKKFLLISLMVFCSIIATYAQNINQGLVAWYPFECSLNDTLGLYNPVAVGTTECDSGKINGGLKLTGGNSYLTVSSQSLTEFYSPNGFSWCLWFKGSDLPISNNSKLSQILISAMDSTLAEDIIFGFGDLSTEEKYLMFRVDTKGGIAGYMQPVAKHLPAGGFTNNEWYHATAVCNYSDKKVYLYVNGDIVDSATIKSDAITRLFNLSIGAATDLKTTEGFFKGTLDEIRIYNRPLSAAEVKYISRLKANQIGIDKKEISWGNILCEKNQIQTLNITNLGPGDFEVTNTRLSSGKFFKIENGGKLILSDGQIYPLSVNFTPDVNTDTKDTLIIENNSSMLPTYVYLEGSRAFDIQTPDTIDFGKVYLCDGITSFSKTFSITSNSVSELIYTGYNTTNSLFDLQIPANDTLKQSNTKTYAIKLLPATATKLVGAVTLKFDSCHTARTIYLKADVRQIVASSTNTIDFGKNIIGTNNSKSFSLYNTGNDDFTLKGISTVSNKYTGNSSSMNQIIASGDSARIDVTLIASKGEYNDTLIIQYESPCGVYLRKIYLSSFGAFEADLDFSSVSLNSLRDTTLNTGDFISIPIYLSNSKFLKESELKDFTIDLSLNPSIFTLENKNSASFTRSNERNIYKLNFKLDTNKTADIFYTPKFKINLGNAVDDTIILSNFQVSNAFAKAKLNNGLLRIGNICKAGGERLIILDQKLSLKEFSPNPIENNTNIDFEVIEEGFTKLILVNNSTGEQNILYNEYLKQGGYSYYFEAKNFASGNYSLILSTPTQQISKKLIISK